MDLRMQLGIHTAQMAVLLQVMSTQITLLVGMAVPMKDTSLANECMHIRYSVCFIFLSSSPQGCLYIQAQDGKLTMAVYQLNIEEQRWTLLKPAGVAPPARGSHTVGLSAPDQQALPWTCSHTTYMSCGCAEYQAENAMNWWFSA